MSLTYLVIGFVSGGVIAWIIATFYVKSKTVLKCEYINLLETNFSLKSDLAIASERLADNIENRKKEIEGLHRQLNLEFENIASKILDEKSEKFTNLNRLNLDSILKPFGDNIDSFKKKVEEIYLIESRERFSLGQELKNLRDMNQQLSNEANNLTQALRGNSKVQED